MTVSNGWIESALAVLWMAWIIYWIVGEPLYQYAKHESKAVLKRGRSNVPELCIVDSSFWHLADFHYWAIGISWRGFSARHTSSLACWVCSRCCWTGILDVGKGLPQKQLEPGCNGRERANIGEIESLWNCASSNIFWLDCRDNRNGSRLRRLSRDNFNRLRISLRVS